MFRSQPPLRSSASELAALLADAEAAPPSLQDSDLEFVAGGRGYPPALEREVLDAGRMFRADWRNSLQLHRRH